VIEVTGYTGLDGSTGFETRPYKAQSGYRAETDFIAVKLSLQVGSSSTEEILTLKRLTQFPALQAIFRFPQF